MKWVTIWRGIQSEDPTSERILVVPFRELPDDPDGQIKAMVYRILTNSQDLTSFTLSRKVAGQYAKTQGWILRLRVREDHIVVAAEHLRGLNLSEICPPLYANQKEMLLECCTEDEEVFLRRGAEYEVVEAIKVECASCR